MVLRLAGEFACERFSGDGDSVEDVLWKLASMRGVPGRKLGEMQVRSHGGEQGLGRDQVAGSALFILDGNRPLLKENRPRFRNR